MIKTFILDFSFEKTTNLLFISFILLFNFSEFSYAGQIPVEMVLSPIPVDVEGDQNVFANPFDYRNNQIFTVHVEPNVKGGGKDQVNLRTIVRKGSRSANGKWNWSTNVLENRTIRDRWHTQASIALDKNGYVHVAYNMHNMPWQYSVSKKALDITSWTFRGQSVSAQEIDTVKFRNETPFPQIGSAAISGNQITYPMFFKDKIDDLYVTYRYALKPAKRWDQRAFAGGISKYNADQKTWKSIGGPISISNADAKLGSGQTSATQYPFAFQDGYSVYLITLAFDSKNGMHVFWSWREGGAGMDTTKPSYAYSPDQINFFRSNGSPYRLPIDLSQSDLVNDVSPDKPYYAPKYAAVLANDNPFVILQPLSGGRTVSYLDMVNRQWSSPQETPFAATEIVVDQKGTQWAFASGLHVFKRDSINAKWIHYGQIGKDLCAPKALYVATENRFFVHAKSCNGKLATIVSFRGQ